jgi:hypothetical protein
VIADKLDRFEIARWRFVPRLIASALARRRMPRFTVA